MRKEMGNVSKRQQPDHRAENSQRPPMGLQCSENSLNLSACNISACYKAVKLTLYFVT